MKVDRCLHSDIEKVNGELFIKAPAPCVSMSSPTGTSSCWIPRDLIPDALDHHKECGTGDIFILVQVSGTTLVSLVLDLITFVGGDVLAITEPLGVAIPYSTRRSENTVQ